MLDRGLACAWPWPGRRDEDHVTHTDRASPADGPALLPVPTVLPSAVHAHKTDRRLHDGCNRRWKPDASSADHMGGRSRPAAPRALLPSMRMRIHSRMQLQLYSVTQSSSDEAISYQSLSSPPSPSVPTSQSHSPFSNCAVNGVSLSN